jgi:hypothetical protein
MCPTLKTYPTDTFGTVVFAADIFGTVHSQENTIGFKRQHGPQLARVAPQSRFLSKTFLPDTSGTVHS